MQFVQEKLGKDIAKYVVADYLMISQVVSKSNFAKVVKELKTMKEKHQYKLDVRQKPFYVYALYINNLDIVEAHDLVEKGLYFYTMKFMKTPNDTMLRILDEIETKEEKARRHLQKYGNIHKILNCYPVDYESIYYKKVEPIKEEWPAMGRRIRHATPEDWVRKIKSPSCYTFA